MGGFRLSSFAASLVVLIGATARAHSVGDEVSAGVQQPTGNVPRSYFVSERVTGALDVKESFTLRLDAMYTFDAPSPAVKPMMGMPAAFGTSADNIFYLDLGADWDINDHWSLFADVNGSPPSTIVADSSVSIANDQWDALVRSRTWSVGAILGGGWDQASDGKASSAIDASVNFLFYETDQHILDLRSRFTGKVFTPQQGYAACLLRPEACNPELRSTFRNAANPNYKPSDVGQFNFGLTFTETIFRNTDLALAGNYYVYTSDPTQAGYYTLATFGRTNWGAGIAIAPYWFTIRPSVTQRFGNFSAGINFMYGDYVPGQGYDLTLGFKLQYKIVKESWKRLRNVKVWLTGTGQRDVDSTGTPMLSGTLALGAKVNF